MDGDVYNRSFEKVFPIAKGTYDWFGGNDKGLGNDWTKEEWYHSAYQHSRWYAFPGKDRPESITADATYLTEITPATACASPWRKAACTASTAS